MISKSRKSKDSLFVESDEELKSKAINDQFNFKTFQLKNLINLKDSLSNENSGSKLESGMNTIINSKHYLENTKKFVKDCFKSISKSNSHGEDKHLKISVKNPNEIKNLSALLGYYNNNVKKITKKRISKKYYKQKFEKTVKKFIKKYPHYKDVLHKNFRQSVETFPRLLNIFKPESKPQLKSIQENININQLSNLPKRYYQSKNIKSNIQLFCFKYYFFKMKKNPNKKSKYIKKLKNLTQMTGRQIYKWIWDEDKRYQEILKKCSIDELYKREQKIFNSWKMIKKIFVDKVKKKKLWIINKVILKSIGFFSKKVEEKIWNVKLKGLLHKSIFMDFSF
jgi:hypothetical protein